MGRLGPSAYKKLSAIDESKRYFVNFLLLLIVIKAKVKIAPTKPTFKARKVLNPRNTIKKKAQLQKAQQNDSALKSGFVTKSCSQMKDGSSLPRSFTTATFLKRGGDPAARVSAVNFRMKHGSLSSRKSSKHTRRSNKSQDFVDKIESKSSLWQSQEPLTTKQDSIQYWPDPDIALPQPQTSHLTNTSDAPTHAICDVNSKPVHKKCVQKKFVCLLMEDVKLLDNLFLHNKEFNSDPKQFLSSPWGFNTDTAKKGMDKPSQQQKKDKNKNQKMMQMWTCLKELFVFLNILSISIHKIQQKSSKKGSFYQRVLFIYFFYNVKIGNISVLCLSCQVTSTHLIGEFSNVGNLKFE
ncbi:hypothetical protein RFI_14180 [Reticulomyxa filosa]|uniref:Uncharacterized protein n=1 Tax=Reticulomyxa filosa TaxID=46433 RepID=X6NCG1_RETFI|nr:hypothetical protein RFI_14180 [Reticulomyxa filosa]|eukprot:ETO23007.1 hypothetical protein RFI_14180 [Reticulomyxa filosa]